ncbi:MAG TPA: DUF2252 domain-containing protein [Acidimicrobiia bacterium]
MPELKTIEERRAEGRARRTDVPRSSHAGWQAPSDRPDPVALLEERHRRRVPELVPIRVGRMLVSPFTFLRGAAEVMAHDLASTPTSGLRVQACGDAHLLNFGVFATPERHLVFDVNDFDETLPAPWEWDLKRLAASVAVAGRGAAFAPAQVDLAVASMVRGYRVRMQQLSTMAPLDVWYDRVDVDAVLAVSERHDTPMLPDGGHLLERARHHTSLAALPKLTELVDGERRIIEDPPLILRTSHGFDVPRSAFDAYRASLARDRGALLDRYRIVDAARKVVGVGSVGTRCHIVLLMDADGAAPLFLQIKEAEVSVLAPYAGASEYGHEGERVVTGQRLMQAASDVFLGWAVGPYGNHYYVRQLRDMKGSVSIDLFVPDELTRYAMLCGVTLARAHARSGDPAAICGYLGSGDQFDRAIVSFAHCYADQTLADHAALEQAVADGRVEAVRGR